jgi:hypothetical protein
VWPDLALANERAADLQVKPQAEDLDGDATIGDPGFERDRNPRQWPTRSGEGIVTASPKGEPLALRTAEPEGNLRNHGMILPQSPGNATWTRHHPLS